MTSIDAKLDVWKNKLLDLGKRNRLLNYKETARSTLKITAPSYEDLFTLLVREEKELDFPMPSEKENENQDPEDKSTYLSSLSENNQYVNYHDSILQTNKTIPDLQKVLRNLRNKAKTAKEEQGINTLYLCFGFLRWKESEHSDYTFLSPLLLVPVSLTIESIISPFVLSLHEDEIVVNPTLAYKLSTDYGITLPAFNENERLDVFFDHVRQIVNMQKWEVLTDVGMSLLSFLKINMYTDLIRHRDMIICNPLVRALGGDPSGLENPPSGLDSYDFDKNDKPTDIFQVVDADTSQQEAILYAKKGVSFVLQGPPGTGKSQTITNIIAESMAEGKKVLFVSEKMAALEVVHKRLQNAGLDEFCLVLHSHKANKRSVLDQLDAVLALADQKGRITDEAYQKLETLQYDRQKLNDYAKQVYSPVMPLGKTIFEANGVIAKLEPWEDISFPIQNVRSTTGDQYNRWLNLLNRFSMTVGKMTGDYRKNPWRSCRLNSVTNEFRHDASICLQKLSEVLCQAEKDTDAIYETICSAFPASVNGISRAVKTLAILEKSYEFPEEWIWDESSFSIPDEINKCKNTQIECRAQSAQLEKALGILTNNGILKIALYDGNSLLDTELQEELLQIVKAALFHQTPFFRWVKDYKSAKSLYDNAKAHADQINEIRNKLSQEYEDGIYDIDYDTILNRFKTEYSSVFKSLKSSYREDKKLFLMHSRQIGKKISDEEMIDTLELLRQLKEARQWYRDQEIQLNQFFGSEITSEKSDYHSVASQMNLFLWLVQAYNTLLKLNKVCSDFAVNDAARQKMFGVLYNGMDTDWDTALSAWHWAERFKSVVMAELPSRSFVDKVCQSKVFASQCLQQKQQLEESANAVTAQLKWFADCFADSTVFYDTDFANLQIRVDECRNGMALLEEWIDFRRIREECLSHGLGDYLAVLEDCDISADAIVPVFQKRFFRLWLDEVLPEYPAVMEFRRKLQEQTISEFAALDTTQFRIAQARIKSRLIKALPSLDHFTSGVDELSVLKRELKKQRKIMPIRKLFNEIPNLLMTLKPCLMMSPLSVSLFLEADSYQFDIVIFDEASQIYTENAIGAIARGRQVVISGDSKQLPPTSFFQTLSSGGESEFDSDDEDDYEVYESVLDEAGLLPEKTLRWHYRSRQESLIAFSNAKIYKSKLITFPSNIESGKDNGVEYIYVPNGYYDRGGRKGNVAEAEKVAQQVWDHIRTQPHRSLGVIAFGEIQQNAIEAALRAKRLENRENEWFFKEDREEAFFVKSLENVQGDERDTIIFSIGYAPDASGVFRMNFGPLGKSGGERRLNVAITRAKYNVKLVGSIMPEQIDVDSISSEGPKLLRSYIDYAINGVSTLHREIVDSDLAEHDSPFEEAIYNYLDRKGYKLGTQVGCSGFRIDIGVKHPTISGVYVLGVECDGASYHSARSARERDRLRQDVLENMGWKIYRVWSTDWIKDPVSEGQRLVDAIEDAIVGYDDSRQQLFTQQETEEEEVFLEVEKKAPDKNASVNPYGFDSFQKTSFAGLPTNRNGYLELSDCIDAVVKNEYPIHYDLLCQRLAGLFGNEKATVRVRREVDYALNRMNNIKRIGDFFFPRDVQQIPIRLPNTRSIQYIHVTELGAAMLKILEKCVGPTRKTLIDETARVYDFKRTGPQISSAMNNAIEYLLKSNLIEEIDGKLRIRQ